MSLGSYLKGLFARSAPPKAGDILSEQGTVAATGGVRNPQRESEADTLTPERLAAIMRDADQGNVEAYLTLAAEMEEREPHYRSVLGTRKLAVSGAPLSVEAPDDSAHHKAIVTEVEKLLDRPEAEELIIDLLDGIPKSFSAVEIMWDRDSKWWEPTAYKFREQRHFVFDTDTMEIARLKTIANTDGEELKPYKWIVHRPKLLSGVPIRTGLARTVAVVYAAKRYTIADWLAYLDVFGMPPRVGKFPANMVSKKSELLAAIRRLGTDAACVIPEEMKVELLETKVGSGGLFKESAEYWDKQTSKVVLGQTMSSDDGSSLAQSKTHERVRFDIRAADARSVAATINRDLIRPFVDLNFGPQEVYPKVKINTEEPEDKKVLVESAKIFVSIGGQIQESELRDRLGFAEPEKGARLLEPESVINAKAAPKPDPNAVPAPGDKPAPKPGAQPNPKEANRAGFDVVDDIEGSALKDWRPLLSENVGVLIKKAQDAETKEELLATIEQLADDEGDEVAIALVTGNLARAAFRVRGVGDATDKTEGV